MPSVPIFGNNNWLNPKLFHAQLELWEPISKLLFKERFLQSLSNKFCCIFNTTAGMLLLRHLDCYYFKLWKPLYWLNLMKITSNLNRCVGSNGINSKWAVAKWEIFIVQWVISWSQCYFLRGKQSRHQAHPLLNSYWLFPRKTILATHVKWQCYEWSCVKISFKWVWISAGF